MKRQTSVARYSTGVLLAMIGLPIGFMASAYSQDRPFSGPVTKTLSTSPSWIPTGNLNTARSGHTATLLANGKVLVVGGRNNVSPYVPDSAELYDPATGV
ncbi:MAG TPA: kelch repeat-containing protein [Casimicrobiaceae bacterium]|jgi:hypothetical protein|nr:kelch repeat-containing protein [Casimicrobiaceae bacterium]